MKGSQEVSRTSTGVEIWIGSDNVGSSLHFHNGMDEHVPNNVSVLLQNGMQSQTILKLVPLSKSILTRDRIRKSEDFCWAVESTITCHFHHILHRHPFHVTPETSSVSVVNEKVSQLFVFAVRTLVLFP